MWYKQLQLFQLADSINYSKEEWTEKLTNLEFTPCLPSHPVSVGWVSPIDEDDSPLVHIVNGQVMLCMQIEEKILPATVIRQELAKKIKEIEQAESRKVYQKEKLRIKDELTVTLLLRSFTKITRLHAYIDTANKWLVLGTTNAKKTEQFLSLFQKSISENLHAFQFKQLSSMFTHWIVKQKFPMNFAIEKTCMLQDPNQQNRIIRCQQQNLFAAGIQSLIQEGCEVKQIGLSWHDKVHFVLAENFSISSIKFQDEVRDQVAEMEAESRLMQFNADSLIMTATLGGLLKDLLEVFVDVEMEEPEIA